MKLKNKISGEIKEFALFDGDELQGGVTLESLTKEWEDYEEPKEYWFIDYDGGILCGEFDNSSAEKMMISMGNHFESLEEAEKAVEKLKAWKRLKDKNVFIYLDYMDFQLQEGTFKVGFLDRTLTNDEMAEADKDLDLLFGGEE